MTRFTRSLADLEFLGSGLQRPESVSVTRSGIVYACDARGGLSRISPDGQTAFIGKPGNAEKGFLPNGFALLPDGGFLVANIGPAGGVWRLDSDGDISPWMMEVDGVPLGMPNFVFRDWNGRVWISALPHRMPPVFAPGKFEGFIAVVDGEGARIAARGIDMPNELRIDPARGLAYVNETFLGRMLQFRIGEDGILHDGRVLAAFDRTDNLDGLEVDAEGHVWTTSIIVNRLHRVNPQTGGYFTILEDSEPEWAERAARAVEEGQISRAILYEENALTLKNISSIAFGGEDLRTVHLGSMAGSSIVRFRSPVAGLRPPHWDF